MNTGTRLGPYEILAPIGVGGMGEVYRARDPRLGRDVAIKISKQHFTERFEREARAVAALNHPHICQIYDVGPDYIVMELVDGVPLKGPLPVQKAIDYAGQILDALDAAHRKGITHRDLKPANILVTKQGVKLLDFGLAKQSSLLTESDATGITVRGQILGTPQYMSPEQLQGKEADPRSDLFSFGCVLYEMLSGKQAFSGSSTASVIAAILEREPAPLETTPPLDRVVKTSLAKDPDERIQSARDLKRDLQWALDQQPTVDAVQSRRVWWLTALASAALAASATAVFMHSRQPAAIEQRPVRLSLNPPEDGRFASGNVNDYSSGGMALSPDGHYAAYVATVAGKSMLWLHPMDDTAAKPIPGTEGASLPFWSPDSRSVAFVTAGKLQRTDVAGGSPQLICDLPGSFRGGSWGSDGLIVFAGFQAGLFRVSSAGEKPSPLTSLDSSRGDISQFWPQMLDRERFLYFLRSDKPENTGVYAASLSKPAESVRVLSSLSAALYAPPGYLLWVRGTTLVAQSFDIVSLRLAGEPRLVADPISFEQLNGRVRVSASDSGLLLYDPARPGSRLIWLDRTGKSLGTESEVNDSIQVRLSPDGRRAALERPSADATDIWIREWDRGVSTRFSFTSGFHGFPVWSPAGLDLLYTAGTPRNLYRRQSSGTGTEVRLTQSPNDQRSTDWSRDGRFALYDERSPGSGRDLWVLPLTESHPKPRLYLRTPYNELHGRFSPEPSPRWVAYQSDETGRFEIYVQAFPEPHGKIQISTAGGQYPQWGPGSSELFYLSPENKLMSVSLKTGAEGVAPSAPRALFVLPPLSAAEISSPYEVDSTGQRFLILAAPQDKAVPLTLVVNWPALLKKDAPGR